MMKVYSIHLTQKTILRDDECKAIGSSSHQSSRHIIADVTSCSLLRNRRLEQTPAMFDRDARQLNTRIAQSADFRIRCYFFKTDHPTASHC